VLPGGVIDAQERFGNLADRRDARDHARTALAASREH
jgi:hypothetical protein